MQNLSEQSRQDKHWYAILHASETLLEEAKEANWDSLSEHLFQQSPGALSRLSTAKGCIERQDFAGKGVQIGKSIDIIGGLQSSLDMDTGGDISANLDALYDYMNRRLSQASLNNDIGIVDEVVSLLREIKGGWDSIPEEFHHLSDKAKTESVTG